MSGEGWEDDKEERLKIFNIDISQILTLMNPRTVKFRRIKHYSIKIMSGGNDKQYYKTLCPYR